MNRMEGKREKSPNEVLFSTPLCCLGVLRLGGGGGGRRGVVGGGGGGGVRGGFQFIAKISATWPSFHELAR
jgi:hypothetical protein